MSKFYKNEVPVILAALLLSFGSALPCFAGENPFSVKFRTKYMLSSDVEHQSGDLEMFKISLRLGYQRTLPNDRPFYINIGPDHYIVDDTSGADMPDEFKSRGIRAGTEVGLPFMEDDRYSFGLELNPTFQTAKDIGFAGDAFRFNFSTFVKFRGDDDFAWVAGANIRPEYEMVAVPIFGFDYRVNDKIFVHLVSDEPKISYLVNETTTVNWDFDRTFDEFEVTGDSNKGAIVQLQEFTTGLSLEHQFNKNIGASVGAGGAFNRILKYQNDTGKAVLENGLYISLKVDANF